MGDRLRTLWRSPVLHIAAGPSGEVMRAVADLGRRAASGHVRYYLAAGTGRFRRAPWDFGRHKMTADPPPTDRCLVERVLFSREEREAAIGQEIGAVGSWLSDGPARQIVVEVLGSLSPAELAFWQACRLRLDARATIPPMVVLRHDPPGEAEHRAVPTDPAADEILVTLLLAGGCARVSQLERWSARRGWDARLVTALTGARLAGTVTLCTYAGSAQRSRARVAYASVGPDIVGELAAMVVSDQPDPVGATVELVTDPGLALTAVTPVAADETDHLKHVAGLAARLFRAGRNHHWSPVPKHTVGALCLAAIAADRRRVSPALTPAVLNLAERYQVDAAARSLLAYGLGQTLAKGDAGSWAASIRCFEYSRACALGASEMEPPAVASRVAACHNGAALAYHRLGRHREAAAAEQAALDVLAAPHARTWAGRYEQQAQILTNLGRVHHASERPKQALACYRRAWRVASDAGSLAAMSNAAPGLVRGLVAADERAEAEAVTRELLCRYDKETQHSWKSARTVAATCWILADANLAAGTVEAAGAWYVEGVRRLHHPVPRVIEAIAQNLNSQSQRASSPVVDFLETQLSRHRACATELAALRNVLVEGDEVD